MERLLQQGTVFHDPVLDRRMVVRHSALLHQSFDMPIAQRMHHLPAHAHQTDILREVLRQNPASLGSHAAQARLYRAVTARDEALAASVNGVLVSVRYYQRNTTRGPGARRSGLPALRRG